MLIWTNDNGPRAVRLKNLKSETGKKAVETQRKCMTAQRDVFVDFSLFSVYLFICFFDRHLCPLFEFAAVYAVLFVFNSFVR